MKQQLEFSVLKLSPFLFLSIVLTTFNYNQYMMIFIL